MTQKYKRNVEHKPGNGCRTFMDREGGQDETHKKRIPEHILGPLVNAFVSYLSEHLPVPPQYMLVFRKLHHDAMMGNWEEAKANAYSELPKPRLVKKTYSELDPVLGYYREEREVAVYKKPDITYVLCDEKTAKVADNRGSMVLTVIINQHLSVVMVKPFYQPSNKEEKNNKNMYYYYIRVE